MNEENQEHPFNNPPEIIETIHGPMHTSMLRHKIDRQEHADGTLFADEWYMGNELVKRSIHVNLKGKSLEIAQPKF
jgi:hypothetical protein